MSRKGSPCTIDGVAYKSETAAIKALEIGNETLRYRLRSSNFPGYISESQPKKKRRKQFFPCSVAGVEYRSVGYAAEKLGVPDGEMRRRLASFDYPDHVCADIPKKPKPDKPLRYRVRGKIYRTLQEIGDEESITRERVRQKINSPLHPDYQRL